MDSVDTAARKLLHGSGSAAISDAATGISSGMGQLVSDLFASVSYELVPPLEALWRWLQAGVDAAPPAAHRIATGILLVALVWYCGVFLRAVAVVVSRALVRVVCFFGHGLWFVAGCGRCCAVVIMRAPGAAGMLISRSAFAAIPALYFLILHSAGAVVASAVFCTRLLALVFAAPVAALFRA
ncbi:hypothetical protein ABZP36_002466 [Zizania latifolia]